MEEQQITYITQLVIDALDKYQSRDGTGIPVGVSARHLHLTQAHVEILFGAGYRLTKKKPLMGGQFACNETVTLVSPSMKVLERVRVLGPVRGASQVELSATDAARLELDAPLRESGDTAGSAGVTVVGPRGSVCLPQGCIVAARHIHMSPGDAQRYGVRDGDLVSVRFGGPRPTVFAGVKIRVDPGFTLEMHIDTDEANAAWLQNGDRVELVR